MEHTERDQILFGYDAQGKQLFRTLGLEPEERKRYFKMLVYSFLVAWLPVSVLTLIDGTFFDGTYHSFLGDPEAQVRLMLALPILIYSQPMIRSFCSVVMEYASGNLVRESDRDQFWHPVLDRVAMLERSKWARIATIVLVVILATRTAIDAALFTDGHEHLWYAYTSADGARFTLAGLWYYFISLPILQYYMARALWKYLLWCYTMRTLSQLNIRMTPVHPDHMGGLSVLSVGQGGFLMFTFAFSCIAAGVLTTGILSNDITYSQARYEMIVMVGICVLVLLAPMLFFLPRLLELRRSALIEYSTLGTRIGERFHERWIDGIHTEENDGIDPSYTTDYAAIYEVAGKIKAVPVTLRNVITWVIVLVVPFIMVMLTQFSVDELFARLMTVIT